MKVLVEVQDRPNSLVQILGDGKEAEIIGRNQALPQQMGSQELGPAFPVGTSDLIDENHWDNPRFACLHQREAFETFIHRSKSARKQGDGVGFFDEVHFPSEKIVKIYQLRVAVDRLVGSLLERQGGVFPPNI